MPKKIFKYQLHIDSAYQTVKIPKGGKVITFQTQFGHPTIWVEVEEDNKTENRDFVFFGTGQEIQAKEGFVLWYIGTVLLSRDELVLHLFEQIKA